MLRLHMHRDGESVGRQVLPDLPSYRPTVLSGLRSALKQIAGMPDYAGYLAHAREQHPDCPLLSEREFCDRYIAERYAGGGSRCC
jgi:uncharacterized short protein YbdD (DUF466 family)